MNSLTRIIISVLLLFAVHYQLIENVRAQGEFETDYKVSYTVEVNGLTNVTQEITLKNKTANYYADSFELKIGSIKASNVKAQDAVGPMETNVKFDSNVTVISVRFNQKVIGVGKTLPWTLSYTSNELAIKSGQIWEVSIPRLAKSEGIGAYEAKVIVPRTFGPIAFAAPAPKSQLNQGSSQVFIFDKEQLTQSGISMSFGEKQVYQFTLEYFLANSNLTTRNDQITLPPDNNYQKVVIRSIDPPPSDVTVDDDGNFIAHYRLSPKQQINITVEGYVEVFSKPFRKIDKPLSQEDKKRYTQPDRYWEVDAATIKDKANELKTPQAIYNFVSNSLTYSDERLNKPKIERLGALAALNSPKNAVCMEFTDLFIALLRSAGIPAKEIVGYAYTQNARLRPLSFVTQGDLLHAWPAYWDDDLGWVHIDPTWGSTSGGLDFFNKLDFNHITLVQRGLSSISPPPAGAFKKEGQIGKKDVIVSFAQDLPQITSTPQLSLELSDKIIAGIPTKVTAKINNIGSTSILSGKMLLESKVLTISSANPASFSILPPYSKKEVDFSLLGKNFLTRTQDVLILSFNEVQLTRPVTIIPIYYLFFSMTFLTSLVAAIIIIVLGLILYQRVHKKKLTSKRDLL